MIEEKNYSLLEMIEIAKKSEYGVVWFSPKGPIQITKDGDMKPIFKSFIVTEGMPNV